MHRYDHYHRERRADKAWAAYVLPQLPVVGERFYIEDIIEVLEKSIENYTSTHSKNIITLNSAELISIREVADRIAKILGKKEFNFRVKEKIKNNTIKKNIYNWKSKTNFNDGLRKTVKWYKDYLEV